MKFKVDVSSLEAGDSIEQAQCEEIIGFNRTGKMYEFSFELMQLAEYVQSQLWKIGKELTVVSHKGSVRVLTHEEASEYNASRFDNAIKKCGSVTSDFLPSTQTDLMQRQRTIIAFR